MAGDTGRSGSVYGGVAEPCTVVLFGASGDLAKRKVIPAMYDLATHNALGSRYAIVGFARTPMSEESFRTTLGEAAKTISEVGPIDPKQWDDFASNLFYCQGDYANQEAYAQLAKRLAELLDAHHHRKTFWTGPGFSEGLESDCPQRFRRTAGLPYRSLPGQGHGAKPARSPVWQRDFRAALEPELRRPRANHRIGNPRC